MSTNSKRLTQCFSAVFPELGVHEIEFASTSTVSSWDSIASVTLVSVIEEEFQIQLTMDELENFNSYALALAVLNDRHPSTS